MPYDEEESSGSDSDAGFDEDMEALRKACSVTGVDDSVDDLPKPSTAYSDYDDTYTSEDEDIELLRNIQQRFSVPTNDVGSEHHSISMKPLSIIMPSGLSDDNDDYGDDFETLRAIQRRFSQYYDTKNNDKESSVQKPEQVGATNIELEKETSTSPNFFVKSINNGQGFPDCVDGRTTNQKLDLSSNSTPDTHEPGSEIIPAPDCGFPRSAQAFVEAIKKNRICQKFIRNKIGQIEAKMEENKKLRERVKILKDFQVACRKKTGRALSQKKDPRIQLISVPKQRANAAKDKEMHAINQGPAENLHVADYRDAMSNYPFALTREPWSKEENENLLKGVKQQFQEMLMQNILSSEDADWHDVDTMLTQIKHHEISPEEMRAFLPKVNWDHLASMYITSRTGPECKSRWMNSEDPLINFDPWTVTEDKKLLYTVQNLGLCNWAHISDALGTNRTPFQSLSRFQRSLNASIIKNEWTPPEDDELRNAVAEYGDANWQLVASTLEGRTGTQCSNRWKKSLNPMRERVGKWAPDEDKRLKIAVKLFGAKNWNKIARYVAGRTQVQCRERWVNCLDPGLNMKEWTKEEDLKLRDAIAQHGYSWSKIAACLHPRTDSQCRRRWKVVLPHEVPMLQRARKMKKAALISNFVDREDERPALTVNDFIAPMLIEPAPTPTPKSDQDPITADLQNQRSVPKIRSRRARKVNHTDKALRLIDEDDDDIKGNTRSKKKQKLSKNNLNISSQESGLSDLNNGALDGDNSKVKKKAKRKRKQRGSTEEEEEEMNETLGAFLNQKEKRRRRRPCLRGCQVASSTNNITESHDVPFSETPNEINPSPSSNQPLEPAIPPQETPRLSNGDTCHIKTKATPNGARGNEEDDESLEGVAAIINQKTTTRPRSRPNRGPQREAEAATWPTTKACSSRKRKCKLIKIRDGDTIGSFFTKLKKTRKLE
ncbi:hypothetical protein LXL04_020233 [Taraxacum kok-saghyz]